MTSAFQFRVTGPPQPKQRARRGKNGSWYTPAPTARYEWSVRAVASLLRPRWWPLDARYRLTVRAVFADQRRRDLDNVVKSVSDALNGIAFGDDSQIDEVRASRGFSADAPATEVLVEVVG